MLDLNTKEELTVMERYLVERLGVGGLNEGTYSIETSFVLAALGTSAAQAHLVSDEAAAACWKIILRMKDIALGESTFPEANPKLFPLPDSVAEMYFLDFVGNHLEAAMRGKGLFEGMLPATAPEFPLIDICLSVGIYWFDTDRHIRMAMYKRTREPVYPRCTEWHLITESDNILF